MSTKSTKRALLSSILALVLCASMLVGTTFAWFTDSVTSANNIIKSGNLDIVLEYWNGQAWVDVEGKSDIITNELWEPGVTEVAYLRLKNNGSLALKYQLGVNIASERAGTNMAGQIFQLSDYIYFDVVDGVNGQTNAYTRDAAMAVATENTKISTGYTKAGTLEAGSDYVYLAMIVHMPTTVGNEANHKTGTDAPEINLGINVFATQAAVESDAFGSDYDQDTVLVSAPVERPAQATTAMNLKGANDVVISLPAAVINALPEGVEEIGMAVSDPVIDTTTNTVTFASVELVDQNGDKIDLSNNEQDITVTLPLPENSFEANEEVMVYHDGEFVAIATVDANGNITYPVAHLCEITVGVAEEPVVNGNTVEIANVAQLFGFAQSVNNGTNYYAGKTVILTADIDLKGAEWAPIGSAAKDHGFMGNFDGNGKVIYNLSIKNIELDSDGYAYAGFFGVTEGTADAENYIKDLVIENVTIDTTGNIVAAAVAYPYYTTLENITVRGNIAIKGGNYTAGALAYTRRCTTASNITVNGNAGSYITGAITVGGVISDIQTNGGIVADYSNFSASNVTITGNKNVGGISGIIGKQTLNGATVENVTLVCSDVRVGAVSGAFDSNPAINNATVSNVTGATAIVGAPYDSNSVGATFVIDGKAYVAVKNADELKAALANGGDNYVLTADIVVPNNETLTVANGKTVVIDLNGKKITGTADKTGNQELFLVKGNLTVKNGSMSYTASNNQSWNAMITIFDVTAGGVLTMDNVTASVAGSDMNFIVHLNNWGSATLTVTDCDFTTSYVAIRAFNSGYDMNTVVVENTKFHGGRVFWVHNYTAEGKGDSTLTVSIYGNGNTTDNAKPVRYGFDNEIYFNMDGVQLVTATTLAEVMAAAKNGNVIIDAQGANLGDFDYDGTFGNGTVLKNATFTYVYGASVDGVATFENCKFVSDHSYSANFSDGSYTGKVIFNNCYFDGWNSFGDAITNVEMNGCTFAWNNPYSMLRFYQNAQLNNCVFEDIDGIDTNKAGTVVKLNNCTGIEGKIYNNTEGGVVKVGTWIVDGVELTDVPAW